jgi:hypothetical protein
MKRFAKGLLVAAGLAVGCGSSAQEPGDADDLVGEWGCYGVQENEAGLYHADYSIVHAADGTWRSDGSFGSLDETTGVMPFEWDFGAAGTWATGSGALVYTTENIRFLPTRGGADYEAADPNDYLRIPMNGAWRLNIPEDIFMTLESDDGLLVECEKQMFDY